jgi:hypothetical protein
MPCEKQNNYLQSLPKTQYQHFINLYRQVKEEGLESQTFNQLFKALYQSKVIQPFDYMDWQSARQAWSNADYDFSRLSLVELFEHLTAIFRADRFEEGTIVCAFNSGLFEKIFQSMEQKVQTLQN